MAIGKAGHIDQPPAILNLSNQMWAGRRKGLRLMPEQMPVFLMPHSDIAVEALAKRGSINIFKRDLSQWRHMAQLPHE